MRASVTSGVGLLSVIYGLWLDEPRSLLYATDERHVVLKINLADNNPNRTFSVYAGQLGVTANAEDGLPATSSTFNGPRGICGSSNGDVYITQYSGYYIRVVYASNQVMQNYVGTGLQGQGSENSAPLSTPVGRSLKCQVDTARDSLYYAQDVILVCSVRSSKPLAIAPIPSCAPTMAPSRNPTLAPTVTPTVAPSDLPTVMPTVTPSVSPSVAPTVLPTISSAAPSVLPSVMPTVVPSGFPSVLPSAVPSALPTVTPSCLPTLMPSVAPSVAPTIAPSQLPTVVPTVSPSSPPSLTPTALPSVVPTIEPSCLPTVVPTVSPSSAPSISPSAVPSVLPSQMPSAIPTVEPSLLPSVTPTVSPSCLPTVIPTISPTEKPSITPSQLPSVAPTLDPSAAPTLVPTVSPTASPTVSPSEAPSTSPSVEPSASPTAQTTSTVKFETSWAFKLNNNKRVGMEQSSSASSKLRNRENVPYLLTLADQQAIVLTQAAFLNTNPNNVVYVSAQEDDVALLVYATTRVTLHLVDYPELNNNETQLFKQAKGILTQAVQSGSFVASLLTKAVELNSTSFDSSIVTVVLFSDPTFVSAPKYSDEDDGLSVGQVAGLVVGSIVGTFLLMMGVYFVFVLVDRRRHADEKQGNAL